ncbi:MAG: hypothetical protein ACYDBH_12265 [Acidobacteriaceae bacterium]
MDIKFNLTNFAIISVMVILLTMVFAALLEGLKLAEGKMTGNAKAAGADASIVG